MHTFSLITYNNTYNFNNFIKFGHVCKRVGTCKAQSLPLERLVDEDYSLPWQDNKCQTLYCHRDMVLSEGIPPCKPVFFAEVLP